MGRSTVHYADNETNNILKRLHNKLRPAGTPVERVEYIIELLLLRIFEAKLKQEEEFAPLRKLFKGENYRLLFSHLLSLNGDQALSELNQNIFPFYATILTKSREVIKGNLPTKMQDQLVLMEEVFANSNFTNNVKGGVIAEVIGMVNEIGEQWILKTDLLGDAIESALSETGGTRDLGLFRTPTHIRQMMVEMVDPEFSDTIYDPACGTAGFLFDSYEYVIKKAQKIRKFPSEHVANQFYRSGIGGVEYLGRIRKMAAVNMYIRGLNPHNIEQGDSLKLYDPSRDAGSKSIVIANPPFGAERDQPAYPNVWEDYSKESETTILFVKLMFDLLKKGGRCAVVVSEGLLTWGQNSACALRKTLLNEANLRAIISLPQGVFVSKGGQGAKTSILYFEKGGPTDFVWYYKIENDGFSMGTNRKPIEGSQIPQLLTLFAAVKKGNKPPDTLNSFCIPKEWIETLDPRIAERIRKEVKERLTEKNKTKRGKLVKQLEEKLNKAKVSKEIFDEKLWQFDNVVESQIENEVAKAIEKAHTYHFNLQNYRSSLDNEQLTEWKEALTGIRPLNHSNIERRFQELKKSSLEKALQIIASFDPRNALHIEITRDYLKVLGKALLQKNNAAKAIDKMLKKGHRFPVIPLGSVIIISDDKFKPSNYPDEMFTILGVSNQQGVFINETLKGSEIKQNYFRVSKGQFCYNPYRVNVGSIGLNEYDIKNQIISGAYNIFSCDESQLNPKFLRALLKTDRFLKYVKEKANGGVRMDFKIEEMQRWHIPRPPINIQNELVTQIDQLQQIILNADNILETWEVNIPNSADKRLLREFITDSLYGISSPLLEEGNIPVLRMNNLDILGNWVLDDLKYINGELSAERLLNKGDFIFNRTNSIDLVGKSGVIDFDFEGTWAGYLIRLKLSNGLNPHYLRFLFSQKKYRKYFSSIAKPAGGQANINAEELASTPIDYYPIEKQNEIAESYFHELKALDSVKLLKKITEKRIEEIIETIWEK